MILWRYIAYNMTKLHSQGFSQFIVYKKKKKQTGVIPGPGEAQ